MRKIDYAITGSEYETTKAPEWDEPIVLDMTLDDLLNIGTMIMFGNDCSRLISERPRWNIKVEKCSATEE